MRLLDEMFVLVSDDGRQVVLRLDPAHPIFEMHFPGMPITPGVCLVKMLGELLERKTGCKLQLERIVNLKFTHTLSPEETSLLTVCFDSIEADEEKGIHAKGTITANEQVATKFSVIFKRLEEAANP